MGITVSNSAMLAHCQAVTQACGYTEGGEDSAYKRLLFSFIYYWNMDILERKRSQDAYHETSSCDPITMKKNIVMKLNRSSQALL